MSLVTAELLGLAAALVVLVLVWRSNARRLDEEQALDDARYGSRTRHPSAHVRILPRPYDQDNEP